MKKLAMVDHLLNVYFWSHMSTSCLLHLSMSIYFDTWMTMLD